MKKLLFAIIIIGVAAYIFHSKFGTILPNAEQIQGTVIDIKDDIQKSAHNVSDEINKVTEDFTQKKEKVTGTIEKVENVIDAVNQLTE